MSKLYRAGLGLFVLCFCILRPSDLLSEEITRQEEIAKIATEVVSSFKANASKIVTWKGDVECHDIQDYRGEEPFTETRKELIQFWYDAKTQDIKTRRFVRELYTMFGDKKKINPRHDWKLLRKEGLF